VIKCLLYLMACTTMCSLLTADTIPGGDVSGTWYAANSPYYITGSITIPASDTLIIAPGVEVEFQNLYYLAVNGNLEAVGTETDSIHFYPVSTSNPWQGIRFENAPDSSHLAYCTISHAGLGFSTYPGGIICTNSNPVITHCRISDNKASGQQSTYAGGIALINSNARVSWCDISHNRSESHGGGMNIYNSSPVITGCNISGNKGLMHGGGICITGNSSPIITNCTIEADTNGYYGGGIYVAGFDVTISECTIGYNETYSGGGGIAFCGGNMSLDHCTVEFNWCRWSNDGRGGGIFTNGGVLTVDHCTFYCNEVDVQIDPYGMEIHTEGNAAMTVTNSIFLSLWNFWTIVFNSTVPASVSYDDFKGYEGSGTNRFMGNVPPGLGVLTQVNHNGDSCDVYYNIYLDPLFVDWWNLHLTDSSCCIDAGDPLFAYDPDSTITDMGRYFFDQRVPNIALSATALNFGSVTVGQSVDLPFVIYNLGNANLLIASIFNNLDVFTSNWSPLDSMVLPGDSLEVMVTFTPDDTIAFTDTCWIDNNDTLCCVTLTGQGLPVGVATGTVNIPQEFALRQPLPNPCKLFARLQFELPKASVVSLSVYDVGGRMIRQLVNGLCEAGIHDVTLDASGLSAGVYFYRLKAVGYTAIRKVIVTK
jgi:hypothetical protein